MGCLFGLIDTFAVIGLYCMGLLLFLPGIVFRFVLTSITRLWLPLVKKDPSEQDIWWWSVITGGAIPAIFLTIKSAGTIMSSEVGLLGIPIMFVMCWVVMFLCFFAADYFSPTDKN